MPLFTDVSRAPLPRYHHQDATCFLRDQAWKIARKIRGKDPLYWRADRFGKPMFYGDHGNRGSHYGWEICHTDEPASPADTALLEALQWQNHLTECPARAGHA